MNQQKYYFVALVKTSDEEIESNSHVFYQECKVLQPSILSVGWTKATESNFLFHLSSDLPINDKVRKVLTNTLKNLGFQTLFSYSNLVNYFQPVHESLVISDTEKDRDWNDPTLDDFQNRIQEIIYIFDASANFHIIKDGRYLAVVISSSSTEVIQSVQASIVKISKNTFKYQTSFSSWRRQSKP